MNTGYDADMFNVSVRLVYHDNGGVALVTNERKVQLRPEHRPRGILSDKSLMHHEKLKKMEEYRKKHPTKVKYVNDVFVIFSEEFLLGKGSDGTRVYLGLGKDGYGKAVKRINRDSYTEQAKQEKDILNDFNAKRSKYVVNYCYLEEEPEDEFAYLVLDLCEESLESFVKSSTLDELQIVLPKVMRHILKGLADLHSDPSPILHRDIRPSNVLRDVQGNFLIADFGISRRLSNETSTYESIQRGAKNWIAPESYNEGNKAIDSSRYKKQSDVMNAGMVAYYVATKGEHPFGPERFLLDNLLNGKPVGLDEIKDTTLKDLLSWMLKRQPKDRPSANEALKHPYFLSDYEKFEMLCKVGNQQPIKTNDALSSVVQQLNREPSDWKSQMDSDVYDYFCTYEKNGKINKIHYNSSWTECLRLIRNVGQHWCDRPRPRPQPETFYKIGDPKEYFLKTFPDLLIRVHTAVRSNDEWKNKPELNFLFNFQSS
ncbi:serine/threonine-protein kinase/endoribonuclease IRE1-like [Xenia sp. Carnegie-2017]|uniref:serine/threonine-protein kinase/endoribonuclease IRE1-like n=1 Tax=Xenia sp. Carnegie-2017 TaxID=2897299 RepID=UPI001F038E09|nr:serine/threonine-protein kinase/endoribonuclease IRE1-like [Xenia sp. Carnegie-2017]